MPMTTIGIAARPVIAMTVMPRRVGRRGVPTPTISALLPLVEPSTMTMGLMLVVDQPQAMGVDLVLILLLPSQVDMFLHLSMQPPERLVHVVTLHLIPVVDEHLDSRTLTDLVVVHEELMLRRRALIHWQPRQYPGELIMEPLQVRVAMTT